MSKFRYKTSRTIGGYTWYCQAPGILWKTEPIIGYALEYCKRHEEENVETGWYLSGGEYAEKYVGLRFKRAMENAADCINAVHSGLSPADPPHQNGR